MFVGSGAYMRYWARLARLLRSGDCDGFGGKALLVTLVIGPVFLVGSGGRPVVGWTLVARAIPAVEDQG